MLALLCIAVIPPPPLLSLNLAPNTSTAHHPMASSSLRVSQVTLVLLCATAGGIGILASFGFFYFRWKVACRDRLLVGQAPQQPHPGSASENKGGEGSSSTISSLQRQVRDSEQALFRLQGSIQRYHQSQVWRDFGSDEPYRVVVTLEMREEHDHGDRRREEPHYSYHDLTIEFRHLEDMPHTIATFLTLADLSLYVGTTLGTPSMALLGGDESNEPTAIALGGSVHSLPSGRVRQELVRQYHEFGYGGANQAPLWFPETSNQLPCALHSVYMVHPGPQFAILLSDPPQRNDRRGGNAGELSVSCPGRVVGGGHLLEHLRDEPATIVETRVLSSRRWQTYDDEERDELQREEL